jgi:hypothetical protein
VRARKAFINLLSKNWPKNSDSLINYELHNLEEKFVKSNLASSIFYLFLLLPTSDLKRTLIMKLLLILSVAQERQSYYSDVQTLR